MSDCQEQCPLEGVPSAKRLVFVDDKGEKVQINLEALAGNVGTGNIEIVTALPEYPNVDTLYLVGEQKNGQDNPDELVLTELHAFNAEGQHISLVFDENGVVQNTSLVAYKACEDLPVAGDMNLTQIYCAIEGFNPDDYPPSPLDPDEKAWCANDTLPMANDMNDLQVYLEIMDYDIQDACA